ncbi:hypothetical protein [Taibaiella koreensis]|uniref:hypothetical protein n=1 Tax=Taibaiella koreensis TaxID=1268548 RepID=UPI000E59DDAA|nr:hypothetical protein [Taibaiella koreensis]
MNIIKRTIEKPNPSFEELILCFEEIRTNGDVAVIKFDGERDKDEYTVFVSFPRNKREMIRVDGSDLKGTLKKILAEYIEENSRAAT